MLYLLSLLGNDFLPFRLFDYVTFRAGGAALTAFLIVILLGGRTARWLRRLNIRTSAGGAGPRRIHRQGEKPDALHGGDSHDRRHPDFGLFLERHE